MTESEANRKNGKDDKKHLLNTINDTVTPIIKDLYSDKSLHMPDLALHCAQFFHSISRYCFQYYRKHTQEEKSRKSKQIKKEEKQKKQKVNQGRSRRRQEERGNVIEKKPQPPKKPLTAYILFFQDQKPNFVERYPSLNLSELTKLIAKQWKKELTEDEKSVYKNRATEERKRYDEQLQQFKRTYGRLAGRMMSGQSQTPQQQQEIQAIIKGQIQNLQADSPKNVYQNDPQVQIEEISDYAEAAQHQQQEEQREKGEEGQGQEGESSSEVIEAQNGEDIQSQSQGQNEKDS